MDKEQALIREIGYNPTDVDNEWEKELKRNGVDAERMKEIDELIEQKRDRGEL